MVFRVAMGVSYLSSEALTSISKKDSTSLNPASSE